VKHANSKKSDAAGEGLTTRPFEKLAEQLSALSPQRKAGKKPGRRVKSPQKQEKAGPPSSDDELFLKAMDGVRPLKGSKRSSITVGPGSAARRTPAENSEQEEALRELRELVQGKRPIPVEKIPEYMDGPPINSDRRLLKRLRSGDFAIQAYCELHGLTADEALKVCDGFMADSLMSNRRCIAYIHGRGRSSPGKPVLKEMVKNFLNRGRFRRYILAYCSAPAWDGGPGVTYVLLRKRPVKKKRRK